MSPNATEQSLTTSAHTHGGDPYPIHVYHHQNVSTTFGAADAPKAGDRDVVVVEFGIAAVEFAAAVAAVAVQGGSGNASTHLVGRYHDHHYHHHYQEHCRYRQQNLQLQQLQRRQQRHVSIMQREACTAVQDAYSPSCPDVAKMTDEKDEDEGEGLEHGADLATNRLDVQD